MQGIEWYVMVSVASAWPSMVHFRWHAKWLNSVFDIGYGMIVDASLTSTPMRLLQMHKKIIIGRDGTQRGGFQKYMYTKCNGCIRTLKTIYTKMFQCIVVLIETLRLIRGRIIQNDLRYH